MKIRLTNDPGQKWVELTVAKMGGAGVIEAMTKMSGAHCGKNGWNSLWQKWVELILAKMGGTHHGKNG